MSGYIEDANRVQTRLMNLLEMDEKWTTSLGHMAKHQVFVNRWFDKRATLKYFRISNSFYFGTSQKKFKKPH